MTGAYILLKGETIFGGDGTTPGFGRPGVCFQKPVSEPRSPSRPRAARVLPPALLAGRKPDRPAVPCRLLAALALQDQQQRPAKALSEGVKRKVGRGPGLLRAPRRWVPDALFLWLQLCFALSILGNPPVVLLDEPSTGMDPEGQQRMW